MSEKYGCQARLGSMFPALAGIDMHVADLDFPVSISNGLQRGGIHNLQQLLAVCYDDLRDIWLGGGIGRRHLLI